MNAVVKTKGLTREEWLNYRNMGIGGSDVSVIAGINPYKSVYELWLEKTGQKEMDLEGNEYTYFGNLLESVVRNEFTKRTGIKVRQKHMLLQSEKYPFMIANLDGVIKENGELCIFEAKTASAYKKEVWEKEVPAEYILQVQHYMGVTGAKKTYIAALVGGNYFVWHVVERDEEMIGKMIAMEVYFWEKYIINGEMPTPDGAKATTEYFNKKFNLSNGSTINLPEEAETVCLEYDKISNQIKNLETSKNALANQLRSYLGEAKVGIIGERKVSWKSISKNTLDTKKLKEEKPEIYSEYITETSYRRLLVA